jgi:N-acetylglucosaminyldiphosphoundecaprenol N-acetyl-beta-D-mannosaminyltransferase
MSGIVRDRVLGRRVDAATMRAALDLILEAARDGVAGHVCVANVHMVTEARRDPALRDAMERALYVASDGMPLLWCLRRRRAWVERVAGPDLMAALCAEGHDLPVYLLGGAPEVSERLQRALASTYPRLVIGGRACLAIPARPGADLALAAAIRASGARLVFVGLGCPKQELWMAANGMATGAVCIGVGQAFDLLAGTRARAPRWMQRNGLEWLHRLAQEPRRLGPRYLATNVRFLWGLLREGCHGHSQ